MHPQNYGSHLDIMAPPLLYTDMRGERVPKQTSAEATNGSLVST
jgi:hypothetical protein